MKGRSPQETLCNSFKAFVGKQVCMTFCPQPPEEENMEKIVEQAIQLFAEEGTVAYVSGAFTMVGDLHGSMQDLLNIFAIFGLPPETNYIFLGDYVDRGDFSVEVISYLLALKVLYPSNVYLIRGNHEFQHINKVYGFYDEVIEKYPDESMWALFNQAFSYLPLAIVLNARVFCVHGGLSPLTPTVHDIESIKLPIVSYLGMSQVSDLVWSDPTDDVPDFVPSDRGAGVIFGKAAVQNFLVGSHLSLLVRAHQCISTGVHAFAGTLGITIFSHSKYAGENNKCGVATVSAKCCFAFFSIEGLEILEKALMSLPEGSLGLQPYKATKTHKKRIIKKVSTTNKAPAPA